MGGKGPVPKSRSSSNTGSAMLIDPESLQSSESKQMGFVELNRYPSILMASEIVSTEFMSESQRMKRFGRSTIQLVGSEKIPKATPLNEYSTLPEPEGVSTNEVSVPASVLIGISFRTT